MTAYELICERQLAASNKNSIWFAGIGPGNIEAGPDGKFVPTGRKSLANATVQNPVFFTNNIEYAYGYAKGYAKNGNDGYIGIIKVDDLKSVNVLDLTDSAELASIFPDCADSANFYELFMKAEPYFGFNAGKVQQGTQGIVPIPFILARIIIAYRHQDRLGISFDQMYKAFEDTPTLVDTANKAARKRDMKNVISYWYKPIQQQYLTLDRLIFDDRLKDVDFSEKFDPLEYTELYNAYTMAVFKHSLKKDEHGDYITNASGKYVLTRFGEMFPDDKKSNLNRPVSNNRLAGLSRDHGVLSHKILKTELPAELTDEDVRHVNYYLQMTEEIHKWYKEATKAENVTLGQKLEEISRIIDNDDGDSNSKKPGFKFERGTASKYIDNLQYMFYYLISKKAGHYQGCYAPEVLAVTQTPKQLKSKDATIFLWNADNIRFIDVLNYRRFDDIIEKIDAANDADDEDSPFYSAGTAYDDDRIQAIYDLAKRAPDPIPAENPGGKPRPRPEPKNKITADNYLEKFEAFKKKIKPDVDAISSNSPESAAACERLYQLIKLYKPARYNSKSSEYAKKYYAKCVDFLYDVISRKRGRRFRRTSEYQFLRQALGILKSDRDVQEKRKSLQKLKKQTAIARWALENPEMPSAKALPLNKSFSRDMYVHGYNLVSVIQCYLEFGETYSALSAVVKNRKPFSEIKALGQKLRGQYEDAVNAVSEYPNDLAMPEILEMKEKLAAAENLVNNYKTEIDTGGASMRKYRDQIDAAVAARDVKKLNSIYSNLRVYKSDIKLGKNTKYPDKKIRDQVIDAADELIREVRGLISQISAGGDSVQSKDLPIKILWLDDVRDPKKYLSRNDKAESETFARNKDFYAKLFQEHSVINFVWVKSVDEFRNYVEANGLPDMMSFDYDLGKGKPKGADAAKWVVEYCAKNGMQLPKFFAHSANRRGREEINAALASYSAK